MLQHLTGEDDVDGGVGQGDPIGVVEDQVDARAGAQVRGPVVEAWAGEDVAVAAVDVGPADVKDPHRPLRRQPGGRKKRW